MKKILAMCVALVSMSIASAYAADNTTCQKKEAKKECCQKKGKKCCKKGAKKACNKKAAGCCSKKATK